METKVKKIEDKTKKSASLAKSDKTVEKKVITEVKASARFVKISPRKTRLVIDQLRNLEVGKALDTLNFMNKAAVRPITKLLNSAIANAENNFKLDKDGLYIKSIVANDGPILKRWKPRAHGRSTTIRKRSSHINLILGVKKGSEKKVSKSASQNQIKKDGSIKVLSPDEVKKSLPRKDGRGPDNKGKDEKGFLRGMFQRKTG